MARKRIFVDSIKENTIRQVWDLYTASQAAKGVSDITLRNYKQHLHAISKYLDIDTPIVDLSKTDLDTSLKCVSRGWLIIQLLPMCVVCERF